MTDQTNAPAADKPIWSTPVLEEAGTIRDVEGGGRPGLDGNGLPAHS
jgi:hypothetical protein